MGSKGEGPDPVDLHRMADFILLNTLIFHQTLANHNPDVSPLTSSDIKDNYRKNLESEWTHIREDIDYGPIVQLGIEVLGAYPVTPQTEELLSELSDLALDILSSGIHLRHDLMGRIYHKLLLKTVGGYYGAVYTSMPAAVLLSNLTIKSDYEAWSFETLDDVHDMKIIDPACGSGTLLSSSYQAVRDSFIIESESPTTEQLKDLHRILLEDTLYGLDVLDFATHLTLATLAMHNPQGKFLQSNIQTVKNGVDEDDEVWLGSLEFLTSQSKLPVKGWAKGPTDDGDSQWASADLPPGSFDCVIMNPPWTRSAGPNIQFGYETEEVRKKMRDELGRRRKDEGLTGIGNAGIGAHFPFIGTRLLKKEGRMALVLPRSVLNGVSWEKVRDHIYKEYEIEYIITNLDPRGRNGTEGWAWSENTDLGDVLVIGARTDAPEEKRTTKVVHVYSEPDNEVEGLLFAQQIRKASQGLENTLSESEWNRIQPHGDTEAVVYRIPSPTLRSNWHRACAWAHPQANKATLEIFQSEGVSPLGPWITGTGIDISPLKSYGFKQADQETTYPIVWGHNQSMRKLALDESHIGYGDPKSGGEDMFEEYASNLLFASRPHINTEALLATRSPRDVLSTGFWEMSLKDEFVENLALLWLNSTYGFLTYIPSISTSQGAIYKAKKDHLPKIPVPNPQGFGQDEVEDLLATVRDAELDPFPDSFATASEGDSVRSNIDDFFHAQIHDLPDLSDLYNLLAKEPAVCEVPLLPDT